MLRGRSRRLVALAATIGFLSMGTVAATQGELWYGVDEIECDFSGDPEDWSCEPTGVRDCYEWPCPGDICCRVHVF